MGHLNMKLHMGYRLAELDSTLVRREGQGQSPAQLECEYFLNADIQ